jgi:hypothetical protein
LGFFESRILAGCTFRTESVPVVGEWLPGLCKTLAGTILEAGSKRLPGVLAA